MSKEDEYRPWMINLWFAMEPGSVLNTPQSGSKIELISFPPRELEPTPPPLNTPAIIALCSSIRWFCSMCCRLKFGSMFLSPAKRTNWRCSPASRSLFMRRRTFWTIVRFMWTTIRRDGEQECDRYVHCAVVCAWWQDGQVSAYSLERQEAEWDHVVQPLLDH